MSEFILAIDNGSQSTKVHVVDAGGAVHASAQRRLRAYESPEPGHVVHPDDDLWDSIREACREVLTSWAGSPDDIVAVGLCTIRFCRALLDADGQLAEPVMSWMDERVARPHDPAANPRARYVTTSSGYITHRLTGAFVDTAANYQGVWPIDQRRARWASDETAYTAAGMTREMLFDLVDPGELLGRITAQASEATGVPVGLPVFASANDKAVEALGAGVTSSNQVLLSLGTYIAAMSVGPSPETTSSEYWVNFASRPGEYLYESNGIRRGMWTVSWIRDLVFADDARPGEAEEELNAEAALVAPGSDGLMALMDWLAPGDKPYRRGALLGFDGSQGRGHVFRAVLEGIALTMADNIEAMERALGYTFGEVVVTGGGAKSDVMMQMIADILDRPARRAGQDDAAGLGAAICAAVGCGMHENWDEAVSAMVTSGATFTPQAGAVEQYRPVRRAYRSVRAYTDPMFAELAAGEGDSEAH